MAAPDRSSSPDPIGWGIVGPGEIASVFARALQRSGAGEIRGVLGRSLERSQRYADTFGGTPRQSLDDLLGDDRIQAVYIATPHPMHFAAAKRALGARKAVLCEKPMTTSAPETSELIELSYWTGTPLIEAWMYRTHPQIARAIDLIKSGAIGSVRRMSAAFGVACETSTPDRLRLPELGGGVIYDIGGYPLSALTMLAHALGHSFDDLTLEDANGSLIESGVEIDAEASLTIRGAIEANVACSFRRPLGLFVEIVGDSGTLSLPSAFLPGGDREGKRGEITLTTPSGRVTEFPASEHCCYSMEAIEVARLIESGGIEPAWPMVGHAESIAIATLIDAWRGIVLEPGSTTHERG